MKITFPKWLEEIAARLFVNDLRVRRYFPAFIEALRTVCLIRSFQPHRSRKHSRIEIDFADFAITALIFDRVFVESLHLSKGSGEETRRIVKTLSSQKKRPVSAEDVASKLHTSLDRAYGKLRYAAQCSAIRQVGTPGRSNRKFYLANPRPHFVPDPKKLFCKLKHLKGPVEFVHPISGKRVVYRHET
jgi:hypothetical protein